jgi:hypothetical protein
LPAVQRSPGLVGRAPLNASLRDSVEERRDEVEVVGLVDAVAPPQPAHRLFTTNKLTAGITFVEPMKYAPPESTMHVPPAVALSAGGRRQQTHSVSE